MYLFNTDVNMLTISQNKKVNFLQLTFFKIGKEGKNSYNFMFVFKKHVLCEFFFEILDLFLLVNV